MCRDGGVVNPTSELFPEKLRLALNNQNNWVIPKRIRIKTMQQELVLQAEKALHR